MHPPLGDPAEGLFSPPSASLPQVTIYVWGHGRPLPGTTRFGCRYTPTAGRYAAAQGWEEDGWSAWAFEVRLLGSWGAVVQQLAPQLEEDPAVWGWAIQSRCVAEPSDLRSS